MPFLSDPYYTNLFCDRLGRVVPFAYSTESYLSTIVKSVERLYRQVQQSADSDPSRSARLWLKWRCPCVHDMLQLLPTSPVLDWAGMRSISMRPVSTSTSASYFFNHDSLSLRLPGIRKRPPSARPEVAFHRPARASRTTCRAAVIDRGSEQDVPEANIQRIK